MDLLTTIITTPLFLTTIVTLGYLATCAVWPFKPCRKCRGAGKKRAPLHRAYRPCRRCHGRGMRLRVGRRAWNAATRLRREIRAHRTPR